MRFLNIILIITSLCLTSCEELIDVNLNEASPRYVIEGDFTNLSNEQTIFVTQTVAFNAPIKSEPINNAIVTVSDDKGASYTFKNEGEGKYVAMFRPQEKTTYKLNVNIDGEVFESSSYMNEYIDVSTLDVVEDIIFSDTVYSVSLKFSEPAGVENFYKYNLSVNGGPFEFSGVFNDKFNDGLRVTHQLSDRRNKIELGDSVVVRRQIIDKGVFKYWNEFLSINPGSAAPANPTSNITNGALGYFSVSSSKKYGVRIRFN